MTYLTTRAEVSLDHQQARKQENPMTKLKARLKGGCCPESKSEGPRARKKRQEEMSILFQKERDVFSDSLFYAISHVIFDLSFYLRVPSLLVGSSLK